MDTRYMRPAKRRVAITAMGAVTPLGTTMNTTWNCLIEGVSRAGLARTFNASGFPSQVAYEVPDFQWRSELVSEHEASFLNQAARYGIQATDEALCQAGLAAGAASQHYDPRRTAVCLGVGMGSPSFQWYEETFIPKRWDDARIRDHVQYFPDQLSSVVARQAGARGGVTTIHTACASSGQAIGEAYEAIAYGDADLVITGGADSMIHPFYFTGFGLLGALSKRNDDPRTASRPFDIDRDGFVLGEGACILVLEDYDTARRRGVEILGELCGYGITESAYRITDLHPEGQGPVEAMRMALSDAAIAPAAVGYINAHGTSTALNDRIEALAISKVFGRGPNAPRVSSTKCMTGHMIAAAGAIELAVCVQALRYQVLPPSVNTTQKDPECLVELTPAIATDVSMQYALSNSVGFGGSNTALVAGRAQT